MRKITSLTLGISFIIMTYTGIMLFLCPHGRVAYWSGWRLFGLDKTQYGNLHTTSMLVFVFFGILHIYYNWKSILNYLKNSSKKISFTKKEFLIALGLNALFVVGTLSMIPPFSGFLHFENSIKNSWTRKLGEPPYGHAELSKLKVFYRKMGINESIANEKLTKQGIKFQDNDTILSIATINHITPNKIYDIIKTSKSSDISIPPSLGRKTLKDLSQMGKINLKNSMEILKKAGLKDISKNMRIRDIADELDKKPVEVYKLIKK